MSYTCNSVGGCGGPSVVANLEGLNFMFYSIGFMVIVLTFIMAAHYVKSRE